MLRILAFTDSHGSSKSLKKITKLAKKADIMVCAGDISIFERELRSILEDYNKIGLPMLIISGNHESDHSLAKHSKGLDNIIHMKDSVYPVGEYHFLCSSGDGFALEDPGFERAAKGFSKDIKKMNKSTSKLILVTHAPPHKTRLDEIMGGHCGNKSIKRFIVRHKPSLAICGHIHENEGKEDHVGKTRVVNPGPYGKIINV